MKSYLSWIIAAALLAGASNGLAYLVGPPEPLEKFAGEANLIFKGEAISDAPAADGKFQQHMGYEERETRFRVISKVKGEAAGGEIAFRHYDELKGGGMGMYSPQYYHFETGRTYIVFASQTPNGARAVRESHTGKMDLGVLRCRDQRPVTETKLPAIYWAELMALRDSPEPADVVYAIKQLDEMSEAPDKDYSHTADFSRADVLTAVRALMARPEPEIAQAAIRLVGAGSPYLSDISAPYWLGTVGVRNPGLATMSQGMRNAGGALCWRDLAQVAQSGADAETRALAIRALGLVKASELRQIMDPWLKAKEPSVRAAAVLLFTDFAVPHEYTTKQFAGFAADPDAEVRKCAAYAIGFMQNAQMIHLLSALLKDADAHVRRAAAESLHSFKPELPEVVAALKADLENKDTQPLSMLALAREKPGEHLDELARVIEENTTPANWSGGEIPAFTAWKLLFRYLWERPTAELQAGKWNRYLDALEKVGNYSSSEPRDLYAFYFKRGLPERAKAWRIAAQKRVTYDLEYYFKQVDDFPAGYLTEMPPAK